MPQHDGQLHNTAGGAVFGPPAPAATQAREPAPSPHSLPGRGGGSTESVVAALGYYAHTASPHPQPRPRAPIAGPAAPLPDLRTLEAGNIARREAYVPTNGQVAAPAPPQARPSSAVPRQPAAPAVRAPAPPTAPPQSEVRTLAAGNLARREYFPESLTVDQPAHHSEFERTADYVAPGPMPTSEPARTGPLTFDPRYR